MSIPVTLTKVAVVGAVVAALAGLVWMYGNARYNDGKAQAAVKDLKASMEALEKLQKLANSVSTQSNDFAKVLAERDRVADARTKEILLAIKDKPLAVVNTVTGKCDLTPTFIQTWNNLNSLQQLPAQQR